MSSRLTETFLRDMKKHPLSDQLQTLVRQFSPQGQLQRLKAEELLQFAEWLLMERVSTAPEATFQVLKLLLQRFPQWADTHYLYTLGLLYQGQPTATLIRHLEQVLASPLKGSVMALWRLLAEQHLKAHQYVAAARALTSAFEAAAQATQTPLVNFVHCVRDGVGGPDEAASLTPTRQTLAFDLALFDALFPWRPRPCTMAFRAVTVTPTGQVWVAETYHRWLFCFDAQGHFCQGLREHDLTDHDFLHPEYFFQLRDLGASAEHLHVVGSQDQIHSLTATGQPWRTLEPPAGLQDPLSLAVRADDHLFVLYQNSEKIHHFNGQGVYQGAFGKNTILANQHRSYFCGVAATADRVFLYDRHVVQAFVPGSLYRDQMVQRWTLPGQVPAESEWPRCWNGVSADDQQLWVADTAGHRICVARHDLSAPSAEKSNPSGDLQPLALKTALKYPNDLAADGQRGVYIADTGNARVLHVNAAHQISSLLAHPRFVAEGMTSQQKQRKKVNP